MTPGPGAASRSKLPQLLVSVLLLGIADSMIGPYLVLFGAAAARLSAPGGRLHVGHRRQRPCRERLARPSL